MSKKEARSGTFTDNMKLPVHRWFRYSAGFSAEWVKSEITRFETDFGKSAVIFDPFAGSGTTAIASNELGRRSYGFDGHPFVARVAKAKSLWHTDIQAFKDACYDVYTMAEKSSYISERYDDEGLLGKCYDRDAFDKLERLKISFEKLSDGSSVWELVWLNLTSILRACSGVGTAQWQYILPNKTKSKVLDPLDAFITKMSLMIQDMDYAKTNQWTFDSIIYEHDARKEFTLPKCNLLITSPPYPNNYDYADATRLEMTFWGDIKGWADLKTVVRPSIMRSCSQHSASDKVILDEILKEEILQPIIHELTPVVRELEEVRLNKGGKKTYHTMVAAYFLDLAKILNNSRDNMESNSRICFVIGDSAPYGVHVPAERWIGDLALAAGFKSYTFEKLRDRNVKWKNRTHTVPLHEGRLWIEG